jgi:hypothetical protein
MVAFASAAAVGGPTPAWATTNLPTTTYSSDAQWTLSGSPYVLNGNITVASGATLSISEGVIVKFNGQSRQLTVNGQLHAIGTAGDPITFTSVEDSAPGQWAKIRVTSGSGASYLRYVDVRYGGSGTVNYGSGAIEVAGSTANLLLEHATVHNNQRSGVLVSNGGMARVASSAIYQNANGISVSQAFLALDANSAVADNSNVGLWFNFTSEFGGPASKIMHSSIYENASHGLSITANSSVPDYLVPYGNRNNIYGNGDTTDEKDLFSTNHFDTDWTDNFWGTTVFFAQNAAPCLNVSNQSPGHLAFSESTSSPKNGPISSSYYVIAPVTKCAYDRVRILGDEFATTMIDNSDIESDYGLGFETAYYSFGDDSCTNPADPITMVFYGDADAPHTYNHLKYHSGWSPPPDPDVSSPQYFYSSGVGGVGGVCKNFDAELVNPVGEMIDRSHVRLSQAEYGDPLYGNATVATPHLEEWFVPCTSHATRSYTLAREELESALSVDHHPQYVEYIGNTDTMIQCDGTGVSSDGYVDFIYVPETIIHPD